MIDEKMLKDMQNKAVYKEEISATWKEMTWAAGDDEKE